MNDDKICATCGTANAPGANFCASCGSGLAADTAATGVSRSGWDDAVSTSPAAYGATTRDPAYEVNPGDVRYCGFWRRLAAGMIDGIIQLAGMAALTWAFIMATGYTKYWGAWTDNFVDDKVLSDTAEEALGITILAAFGLYIVGMWMYSALFESSARQATPGKRVFGVVVVDLKYRRISFGRATGRFFARVAVQSFIGSFEYLSMFGRKKQAVHDMMAGTYCIRGKRPETLTTPTTIPATPSGVSSPLS